MPPPPVRRFAAFTLIELLVVVAIIAVLASLLLPVLGKAREIAKAAVCLNNQKQVALAENLYADDFGGVFAAAPRWLIIPGQGYAAGGRAYLQWSKFLIGGSEGANNLYRIEGTYLQDGNVLVCPEMEPFAWKPTLSNRYDNTYGFIQDGTNSNTWYNTQYAELWYHPLALAAGSVNNNEALKFFRMDAPKNVSEMILVADSRRDAAFSTNLSQTYTLSFTDTSGTTSTNHNLFSARHANKSNVVYWDGHAESADVGRMQGLGVGRWFTREGALAPF